jgi:hypothetical protein
VRTGFPTGEEFKWSPDRATWMHRGLVEDERRGFFLAGLELARRAGATAIVVAEDANRGRAHSASETPEDDVVTMFLERAQNHLRATGTEAMLVFDRPGGGPKEASAFLAGCIETIGTGTAWVDFDHLTLALASDSKFVRLLQLADLVAGCTVSRVGGETPFSAAVFESSPAGLVERPCPRLSGLITRKPSGSPGTTDSHWALDTSPPWIRISGAPLPCSSK